MVGHLAGAVIVLNEVNFSEQNLAQSNAQKTLMLTNRPVS